MRATLGSACFFALALALVSCATARREAPREGRATEPAAGAAAAPAGAAAGHDASPGETEKTAASAPAAPAREERAPARGAGSGAGAAETSAGEPHDRAAMPPPAPAGAPGGLGSAPAPKRKAAGLAADEIGGTADRSDGGYVETRRGPSRTGAAAPAPAAAEPVVQAPAMKAGRHDDNKEYNRFLAFLGENASMVVFPVDVSERLVVRTVDRDGKSIPNCAVTVAGVDGRALATGVTYADGRTQFFPGADARPTDADFAVTAKCGADTKHAQLPRAGRREVEVRFGSARALPRAVPVDVAILIDTTGSMQSQIDRLKKTLRAIHFQLTQLSTRPDVRFGLVAFRDRGDDYVTRVTPFTEDVASFQRVLDGLEADGGGDTPEDMQAALDKGLHGLAWRPDAVRVGFVISDAVPHTDYSDEVDYRAAMRESLRRGIKWVMVGAGGLGRDGEVIYRQVAQHTMAEYVFITDSGPGDSEGGAGEASHHVGTNYKTENLDQAIVRIVRRELSYLTDSPRDFDDTIVAQAGGDVPRDEVLGPAVEEALRQLADYSSLKLGPRTPVAVVPVTASDRRYDDVAGYLSDRMTLAASRNPTFRVVERDLKALAQEQKLQLSDLFDVTETVPIGKLVGAEAIVVAKLTVTGAEAALFAKLIRVETGEVLSVSRVEIAKAVLGKS